MGRPKDRLVVAPSERERLDEWSRRPKTAQALAMRARIILRCAAGEDTSPLLPVRHQGRSLWVCTHCLPALIHW